MRTAIGAAMAIAALGTIVHAAQFRDTYRAPGIEAQDFAGKKVAALVIAGDQALRMSAEEALARALTERGVQGVASYRLLPPEELRDKDRARPWFERAGVEGIVIVRPITMETTVTKYEAQWSTAHYQSLWGYYGYGWSAVWTPGRTTKGSILVVETMAYSVPMDLLLWGGISEERGPKDAATFLKELVRDGANEMRKAGLIRRGGS